MNLQSLNTRHRKLVNCLKSTRDLFVKRSIKPRERELRNDMMLSCCESPWQSCRVVITMLFHSALGNSQWALSQWSHVRVNFPPALTRYVPAQMCQTSRTNVRPGTIHTVSKSNVIYCIQDCRSTLAYNLIFNLVVNGRGYLDGRHILIVEFTFNELLN